MTEQELPETTGDIYRWNNDSEAQVHRWIEMDTDPNQKLKGGICIWGNVKKHDEWYSWHF
jgi:hypothetical protein